MEWQILGNLVVPASKALQYLVRSWTKTTEFDRMGYTDFRGGPVAQRVEAVPLRPCPYGSDPGAIPARGPLLNVLPSLPHTFLSNSLYLHE